MVGTPTEGAGSAANGGANAVVLGVGLSGGRNGNGPGTGTGDTVGMAGSIIMAPATACRGGLPRHAKVPNGAGTAVGTADAGSGDCAYLWTVVGGSASMPPVDDNIGMGSEPAGKLSVMTCVERSWVWLSMASHIRLFSLARSSSSLRTRPSNMPTVRCNASTRSSTDLPTADASRDCNLSALYVEMCCSRAARSFINKSCSSLCRLSCSALRRWSSSWNWPWCFARSSRSCAMRSCSKLWCRSRAAFSWPKRSATACSCTSRAFCSRAIWLRMSRSCASRACFSLPKCSEMWCVCCSIICDIALTFWLRRSKRSAEALSKLSTHSKRFCTVALVTSPSRSLIKRPCIDFKCASRAA
mmetsp:Transcript_51792/g.150583  ORF Transcript_51792/g.150583 Transcript_51792/m.150583 type:complete len:357 (+) Transcript_51792:246-1316(+)